MIAVMISLDAEQCYDIFRSHKPAAFLNTNISMKPPYHVYVYENKKRYTVREPLGWAPGWWIEKGRGRGKVIGHFTCTAIHKDNRGILLNIRNLREYDTPASLENFTQSCQHHALQNRSCRNCKIGCRNGKVLTTPPKSVIYVERNIGDMFR